MSPWKRSGLAAGGAVQEIEQRRGQPSQRSTLKISEPPEPRFDTPAATAPTRHKATEVVFSRETSAAEVLELLLNNSLQSVDAALHQLSNPRLLRALAAAAKRGLHVRLVLDQTKFEENIGSISALSNGHMKIRLLGGRRGSASRMHHKFAVVDRSTIVTGSYNWTVGSDEQNYENLVIFHGRGEVEAYQREFSELWRQAVSAPLPGSNKQPVERTLASSRADDSGEPYSLYLMRHGQILSDSSESARGKGESPLSPQGKRKLEQIAKGLLKVNFEINWIVASPLRQASDTANLVASELNQDVPVEYCEALSPTGASEDVVRFLRQRPERRRVLLVGHEPGLSRLAVRLLQSDGDANLKLKKGGCCLLTFEEAPPHSSGRLQWWLTPRLLRKLH